MYRPRETLAGQQRLALTCALGAILALGLCFPGVVFTSNGKSEEKADAVEEWWRQVLSVDFGRSAADTVSPGADTVEELRDIWPEQVVYVGRNEQGMKVFVRRKDAAPMILVPAGVFRMGSPDKVRSPGGRRTYDNASPAHVVSISEFALDAFEVTWAQYASFWKAVTGKKLRIPRGTTDRSPVYKVSWHDAGDYCAWVGGRLPSEAEWEYAAGGSDGRPYVWGAAWPPPNGAGNLGDVSAYAALWKKPAPASLTDYEDGYVREAPVGSFPLDSSPFGIKDMAGNVSEWVGDWYAAYPSPSETDGPLLDPAGPSSGTQRVVRGSSWYVARGKGVSGHMYRLRVYARRGSPPWMRSETIGFRCAVAVP